MRNLRRRLASRRAAQACRLSPGDGRGAGASRTRRRADRRPRLRPDRRAPPRDHGPDDRRSAVSQPKPLCVDGVQRRDLQRARAAPGVRPGRLPVPLHGRHRDDRAVVRARRAGCGGAARGDVRARRVGRPAAAPGARARSRRREAAVLGPSRGGTALRLGDPGTAGLPRPAAARESRRGGAVRRARIRPRPVHHAHRHFQAGAGAPPGRRPGRRDAAMLLGRGSGRGTPVASRRPHAARRVAAGGRARAHVRRAGRGVHERGPRLIAARGRCRPRDVRRADPHVCRALRRAWVRREPKRRSGDAPHPHQPSCRHRGRAGAGARPRRGHPRARRADRRPGDPADLPPRRGGTGAREGRIVGGGSRRAVRRLPDLPGPSGSRAVPPGPSPRKSGAALAREPPADVDREGHDRIHA